MVQCVGSRDKSTHIYCSKICCAVALKNARSILQKNPDTEITICYKDIRLAGKDYEHYYVDCQNMGVNFINGDVLEVKEDPETKMLKLKVKPKYGEEVELEADLVVLTCALVPAKGMEELARTLNLSLSPDGFFMELHPKLAPVDTNVDGIYICGVCVVECPARAIQLRHYKDDQIFAAVSGVLKEV